MIYVKKSPPNTALATATYEFLAPVRLTIRKPDGSEVLMGYGIGEKIEVLEPGLQFLVHTSERLSEIPLADGSYVVKYPEDIRIRLVYPEYFKSDNHRGREI